MRSCKCQSGLTLIEMLVVVAIVAILVSVTIGIASRIENQSSERLVMDSFAILNTALGQFQDYKYNYNNANYSWMQFPPDCNGFDTLGLATTLRDALNILNVPVIFGVHNDPNYSGIEAVYFFLSQIPACRKTLDRIDSSLITSKDSDKQDMSITITFSPTNVKVYPLLRVIDPWGRPLRYDYYYEWPPPLTPAQVNDMKAGRRSFPLLTSAGPDGRFGTADDITSK